MLIHCHRLPLWWKYAPEVKGARWKSRELTTPPEPPNTWGMMRGGGLVGEGGEEGQKQARHTPFIPNSTESTQRNDPKEKCKGKEIRDVTQLDCQLPPAVSTLVDTGTGRPGPVVGVQTEPLSHHYRWPNAHRAVCDTRSDPRWWTFPCERWTQPTCTLKKTADHIYGDDQAVTNLYPEKDSGP